MKKTADEKKPTKDPEAEEEQDKPADDKDAGEDENDEEEVVPKKKPAMKRPAAAKSMSRLVVYKYKYKNGKWGFKVNGKEVLGVTGLNNTSSYQSQYIKLPISKHGCFLYEFGSFVNILIILSTRSGEAPGWPLR